MPDEALNSDRTSQRRLSQFLQVPRNLRELIIQLRLTVSDILLLLLVMEQTWRNPEVPAPLSASYIAEGNRIDPKTAKRSRTKMARLGLLEVTTTPDCRDTHDSALVRVNPQMFPSVPINRRLAASSEAGGVNAPGSRGVQIPRARGGAAPEALDVSLLEKKRAPAEIEPTERSQNARPADDTQTVADALADAVGKPINSSDKIVPLLIRLANEAGGSVATLCHFIASFAAKKREKGYPIHSAGLFLKVVENDFPKWRADNPAVVTALGAGATLPVGITEEEAERARSDAEHRKNCTGYMIAGHEAVAKTGSRVSVFLAAFCGCEKGRELERALGDDGLTRYISEYAAAHGGIAHWDEGQWLRRANASLADCPKCLDDGYLYDLGEEDPYSVVQFCDGCDCGPRLRERHPNFASRETRTHRWVVRGNETDGVQCRHCEDWGRYKDSKGNWVCCTCTVGREVAEKLRVSRGESSATI